MPWLERHPCIPVRRVPLGSEAGKTGALAAGEAGGLRSPQGERHTEIPARVYGIRDKTEIAETKKVLPPDSWNCSIKSAK